MVDLVNLNLNHYQFMASYAHGIFYTGFPTPFLFGVNDREIPKGIGVRELWTSSNPDAKAGMLEFTGAGLSFAREYLEDRKNEMASLGARFLGSETKKTETAEKTKLDQFGEASSLAEIAEIISEQFTKILKFLSEIKGEDSKDVFFELSKEFTPQDISPEMVKTLSYELQSGHISYQTFFDNLQKGKIISERRTQEAELDDISNQVLTQ
jgi:signal recognition particle GTPase